MISLKRLSSAGIAASLLACVMASAQLLHESLPLESAAVWRGWRPLVLAVGAGDAARATQYLDAVDLLLRKLDGNLQRDPAVAEIQDKISASYEDLDLGGLLEILPGREGVWRSLALQGAPTRDGYRLSRGNGPSAGERGTFGTSVSVLRMRRLEVHDDTHYALQWRGGIGVGALPWSSLQQGVRDGVRILEEQPDGDPTRAQLVRAADREILQAHPALGPEDRNVLSTTWASFPETARLLASIIRTDDVIVAGPRVDGSTRVRLVMHWNHARLKQLYPKLTDYLENFGDLIELEAKLHDANGNTLASLWFDSARMQLRSEFAVRDGKLVPSRGGKLLAGVQPAFERMHAHVNLHSQAFGIQMFVDDLVIDAQYFESERGMQLATHLDKTPRFRVEGAMFGVVPVGVLNWFVPGDIPGLAGRMFEVAARGNEGRGIELSDRFEELADQRSVVEGSASVEILDSALIRFGMKIAVDRVIPDAAERADMHKLAVALRERFALDVQRFQRYGKPR